MTITNQNAPVFRMRTFHSPRNEKHSYCVITSSYSFSLTCVVVISRYTAVVPESYKRKSSMSSVTTRKRVCDYKSLSDFGRSEEDVMKRFKVYIA